MEEELKGIDEIIKDMSYEIETAFLDVIKRNQDKMSPTVAVNALANASGHIVEVMQRLDTLQQPFDFVFKRVFDSAYQYFKENPSDEVDQISIDTSVLN